MELLKQIIERAKANKQRIVLPEGTEESRRSINRRWNRRHYFNRRSNGNKEFGNKIWT